MPRYTKVLSDVVMDRVGDALGVEIGAARRIILDVQIGQPVRVWVEFLGDTRMLNLSLPDLDSTDVACMTTRDADGSE